MQSAGSTDAAKEGGDGHPNASAARRTPLWAGPREAKPPPNTWSALYPRGRIEAFDSQDRLVRHLRDSSRPLLAANPDSDRFVAPQSLGYLLPGTRSALAIRARNGGIVFTALAVALLLALMAMGIAPTERSVSALPLTLVVLGAVFLIDGRRLLDDPVTRAERTLFHHWLAGDPAPLRAALATLLIMGALGLGQRWAEARLGGASELWEQIGVLYPRIEAGEYWRFLTGPFLRYDLTHGLLDSVMLAALMRVAWPMLGLRALIVALACSTFGAWAQYAFGGGVFDNYGGLSAGAFGLAGYVIALDRRSAPLLPKGLGTTFMFAIPPWILATEAIGLTAATTAHIAGLVAGAAISFADVRRWRLEHRP